MPRKATKRRASPTAAGASSPDRAKEVIKAVLRQAGGELSKRKISTAFWLSHLYFSKVARGYLTDRPIVRMPRGPEIAERGGAVFRVGEGKDHRLPVTDKEKLQLIGVQGGGITCQGAQAKVATFRAPRSCCATACLCHRGSSPCRRAGARSRAARCSD